MEWLPLLFSGVSSLVGGWMGNNAADKATKQQAAAIQDAMKFQTGNLDKVLGLQDRTTGRILGANQKATDKAVGVQQGYYDKAKGNLAPWMKAGVDALEAYSGELGLTAPGGQPYVSKFRETPGYKFAVAEAEKGAVSNMRSLGMGASGAALKALSAQRMGMADQTYNQYLDRLKGVSDGGQGAATNLSQIGAQTGSNIAQTYMQGAGANADAMQTGTNNLTNAYINGGNQIADTMMSLGGVQAGGTVAKNNAWTSALGSFANSAGRTLGNFGNNWGSILGAGKFAGGAA